LQRSARRARARLADFHMDDLVAQRLTRGGGLHHIHDDERRDGAALGGPHGGEPALVPALVQGSLRQFHCYALPIPPRLFQALKPPWLRPNRAYPPSSPPSPPAPNPPT